VPVGVSGNIILYHTVRDISSCSMSFQGRRVLEFDLQKNCALTSTRPVGVNNHEGVPGNKFSTSRSRPFQGRCVLGFDLGPNWIDLGCQGRGGAVADDDADD